MKIEIVFNGNYAFVDVETTGSVSGKDRVIDIGIIRTEKGKIVSELNSLIKSEAPLDPWITKVTGIVDADLVDAPNFSDKFAEIKEYLAGAVIVAHNSGFDYGFLKYEYSLLGEDLNQAHMCTVKLSRNLFPQHSAHNLDAIISRYGFVCQNRHRAYDDAKVLYDFCKLAEESFDIDALSQAIIKSTVKPQIIDVDQISFFG